TFTLQTESLGVEDVLTADGVLFKNTLKIRQTRTISVPASGYSQVFVGVTWFAENFGEVKEVNTATAETYQVTSGVTYYASGRKMSELAAAADAGGFVYFEYEDTASGRVVLRRKADASYDVPRYTGDSSAASFVESYSAAGDLVEYLEYYDSGNLKSRRTFAADGTVGGIWQHIDEDYYGGGAGRYSSVYDPATGRTDYKEYWPGTDQPKVTRHHSGAWDGTVIRHQPYSFYPWNPGPKYYFSYGNPNFKDPQFFCDINGDGDQDILISAAGTDMDNPNNGRVYVIFGGEALPASIDLDQLEFNGSNGFVIEGLVSGAGYSSDFSANPWMDFNGDGFNDVLINTSVVEGIGLEEAGWDYVVFGRAEGFPPVIHAADLDGTNGFKVPVPETDHEVRMGFYEDINGDGYDDFFISVGRTSGAYPSAYDYYLVFGKAGDYDPLMDYENLAPGEGYVFSPGTDGGSGTLGSRLLHADMNGDGLTDFAFEIVGYDPSEPDKRKIAVLLRSAFTPVEIDPLSITANGTDAFMIEGIEADAYTSMTTQDINFDGYDDILIQAKSRSHIDTYAVFGKPGGFEASIDVTRLDGTNGFKISRSLDSRGHQKRSGEFKREGAIKHSVERKPVRVQTVLLCFSLAGLHRPNRMAADLPAAGDFNHLRPRIRVVIPKILKLQRKVFDEVEFRRLRMGRH
ncbi:MAG: hypothetical protein HQL11_05745, partial [Candidatus Omnitrophica bacterium]|nr:hypothetical protein [Candidatus Omnitrophota bacterium]